MLKLFLFACLTISVLVDSIPLNEPVIEGRIIGGNDTDITQVPYQVALFISRFYTCGGIILSPTHILTSNFCVSTPRDDIYHIRAGSSSNTEDFKPSKVTKVHRYPGFNATTMDYDVAVLELNPSLKLNNKTMKAIKLATKEPSPGSVVLASGWGDIKESGQKPEVLQSVSLPIIDRKTCETTFKAKNVIITPRMICAGAKGKMVYVGDYGGPVAYKNELVGIISFGWNVGKDMPGVYTNIANPEITKFIKGIVKN